MRILTNDHCLIIEDVPLPPSDNHLYINVNWGRGRASRVKSPEYKAWSETFDLCTRVHTKLCKDFIAKEASESSLLTVEIEIQMVYERFFTKRGTVRKLDATNRLKAICDALSRCIGIDDSHFWDVRIAKRVCSGNIKDSLKVVIKVCS